MKFVRYSKYVADLAGEMSMEDLLQALSDYLLRSGFESEFSSFYQMPDSQTLDELRDHRQVARLPRLQDAARSAGFAGQIQFRPPRHARLCHRRRGQRLVKTL